MVLHIRQNTAAHPRSRRRLAAASVGVGVLCAAVALPATSAFAATQTPSAAQLQAALLSPTDVGPHFTAQPTDSSSPSANASTTVTGCAQLSALLGAQSTNNLTEQQVNYQAGDTGPFLNEVLATGPTAVVNADYAAVKSALDTCKSLTIDSGGTTIAFTLTPMNFAPAPAAAVRMDATYQGVQVNGYLAVDHVGAAELGFLYIQVGSGSSQSAAALFKQADTKAHQHLAASTG